MEARGSVCAPPACLQEPSCHPGTPAEETSPSTAFLAVCSESPREENLFQANTSFWNSVLADGVTPGLIHCDEAGQDRAGAPGPELG